MATGSMPCSGPVGPCFACYLRLHWPKVVFAADGGSRKSYGFETGSVVGGDSYVKIYCDSANSVGQPNLYPKQPNEIDIVDDGCVQVTKEVSPVGVQGGQDVCAPSLPSVKGRLWVN